jgi:hypothetical protein
VKAAAAFVSRSVVAFVILLTPAVTHAQGSIAGVVRDTTGAVLPGVTVDAASPALIEKVRSVTTDDAGQYTIADLRPGEYSVTFTLPGFSTVVRERIELQAAVTLSVDADLKLGSVEEMITVSGVASSVDVKNSVQQLVVPRAVLDAVPTGRNVFAVGAVVPGIVTQRQDVGGSEGMQMTAVMVHGSQITDVALQVDGMSINHSQGAGNQVGVYYNDGMVQEISYQTSTIPAEVSQGGIRINMIPREGGNELHGSLFATGASGALQSDNFSPELQARGMSAANSIDRIWDVNGSLGGPVKRDSLWFFTTVRNWGVDTFVANTFNPDGTQAIDDSHITSTVVRLTAQIKRSKISGYFDNNVKYRGHRRDLTSDYQFVSPEASFLQTTPLGYTSQAKWVYAKGSKVLFEAGVSLFNLHYKQGYQEGTSADAVPKVDFTRSTLTNAAAFDFDSYGDRATYVGSVSYVTGAHAFKAGMQYGTGGAKYDYRMNQDILLRFNNGLPDSVDTYNTPVTTLSDLTRDLGLYAQDSWTLGRLTLNPGIRFESLKVDIPAQSAPAGRWVGARDYAPIPDVPNWNTVVPRFGLAWNVFGDSKTAVKVSVSKYMQAEATGLSGNVNPTSRTFDRRSWRDLNGDGEAQTEEIGPSTGFRIGTTRRIDPDLARPYNWEYNVTVEQSLLPKVWVTGAYFNRQIRNQYGLANAAIPPSSYTPVTIANPLDGSALTVFNQQPSTVGLSDFVLTNIDALEGDYQGVEFQANARFGNGGTLMGGLTIGRKEGSIRSASDDMNNPNLLINHIGAVDYDSTTQLKIAGSYPMPLGFKVSGSLQSNTGQPLRRIYNVTRAIVPELTQVSMPIDLLPRGDARLERLNQLDLRFANTLQIGGASIEPVLDLYNVFNGSVSTSEVETIGNTLGRPSSILLGRLIRLGVNVNF